MESEKSKDRHSLDPLLAKAGKALAGFPQIRQAFLFGSVVEGKASPDSDLDIAVDAVEPMDIAEQTKLIRELSNTFGRPVDLVFLHRCRGLLLKEILTRGVSVFPRNPDRLYPLLRRMVYEQEDFMPLVRRVKRERAAAFAHEH